MADHSFQSWRQRCASDILGESLGTRRTLEIIRRVATSEASVLLCGETGTGKELFARALHRASARSAGPFIAVNCAAIPEQLIESELFGHLRGAFTGASAQRAGRFAAAAGGTLFLDEIGELPLAGQAKLLRVLEERTMCPVGADADVPVDVRVVAATHRDLEELVAQGKFRADLYFRLSVVPVELPPLRARGDDIELLAEAAIKRAMQRGGRAVALDDDARALLRTYSWPGNVRELNHVVERAVALADGPVLCAADLNLGAVRSTIATPMIAPARKPAVVEAPVAAEDDTLDLRTALETLERRLIRQALERAHGNRTEAAALLGLNRTTLVEKLRKYA